MKDKETLLKRLTLVKKLKDSVKEFLDSISSEPTHYDTSLVNTLNSIMARLDYYIQNNKIFIIGEKYFYSIYRGEEQIATTVLRDGRYDVKFNAIPEPLTYEEVKAVLLIIGELNGNQ